MAVSSPAALAHLSYMYMYEYWGGMIFQIGDGVNVISSLGLSSFFDANGLLMNNFW